ncbi:MAG: stage II sporulation protein M [Bacteroidales bacterium]|nr:stage II sporulation protein M [Bacteroidales bacterium]
MKEIVFLNKNASRWKEFEKIINSSGYSNPDLQAELFIKITDDLSYAQTYFPGSETEAYLNSLASETHHKIYKNKKEKQGRFAFFWKYELPKHFLISRRYIFYSLIIFLVTVLIGVVSSANDGEYSRLILGDYYVNMTIDNIEKGDPMGVYKDAGRMSMFVFIAYNNIKVMIIVYLLGLLLSAGSVFYIFKHGIMIGTFHYIFYQYNVLEESLITVWIHGTIEIFTLIVSGGAGIMLGNSILFPRTYSVKQSFLRGAKSSAIIVVALIPFIIIAAFLEGFVTRHTEWNNIIRIGIIACSFILIIYYFFIYPQRIKNKLNNLELLK